LKEGHSRFQIKSNQDSIDRKQPSFKRNGDVGFPSAETRIKEIQRIAEKKLGKSPNENDPGENNQSSSMYRPPDDQISPRLPSSHQCWHAVVTQHYTFDHAFFAPIFRN
jgi:hypothetical protein